jgi:TfoX/Sxy family transcriptional regulator of competence genes
MHAIVQLIGEEARILLDAPPVAPDVTERKADLAEWEEHLRQEVEADATIADTQKTQIVLARRGQGIFKENVRKLEKRCRVTGVERLEHLRASHIRPWRDSDNQARLDGENGLLLTPSIDHLFDRGFISFEKNGRLLVSPVAHTESLRRMGIPSDPETNVGGFSQGQRQQLVLGASRIATRAIAVNRKTGLFSGRRAMKFSKPSTGLVQQFKAVLAGLPRAEPRKMFGYDCFFVNGNFAAGLWQDTCVFKLSEADGKKLLALGARPFAPMKGRAMKGWYEAPEDVAHDPDALEHWCARALDFAALAPPKLRKTRKKAAAKKAPAEKVQKKRG